MALSDQMSGQDKQEEDKAQKEAKEKYAKSPAGKYDRLKDEIADDYNRIGKPPNKMDQKQLESLFPESHAFLVENRLRGTIEELFAPLIAQNGKLGEEIEKLKKVQDKFENT